MKEYLHVIGAILLTILGTIVCVAVGSSLIAHINKPDSRSIEEVATQEYKNCIIYSSPSGIPACQIYKTLHN